MVSSFHGICLFDLVKVYVLYRVKSDFTHVFLVYAELLTQGLSQNFCSGQPTLMHQPHPTPIPCLPPFVGLTWTWQKSSLSWGAWSPLATSLCDVSSYHCRIVCAVIVKSVNDAVEMSDSSNFQSVQQQHREIDGLLSLPLHLKEDLSHIIVEHPVRCCRLVSYFEHFSSVHIDLIPHANTSVYVTVSVKKLCRLDYCFYWLLIF